MNHEKLLVAVLGNGNSGKSTTWQVMFNNPNIRTKKKSLRELKFYNNECVDVFLINGSPQERGEDVKDMIEVGFDPGIVMCSIQYKKDALNTLRHFHNKGYYIFIHWLNPGYHDSSEYNDYLNLIPQILNMNSIIGKRSGKINPSARVEELKNFIYDWSNKKGLIKNRITLKK